MSQQESAAQAATAKAPRDFTYIKPSKRRLSEYEAVTCYTQLDPDGTDRGGWMSLGPTGQVPWRKESTRLVHPNWFEFRDPAGLWQRPYVRLQAEQERAIQRATEELASSGAFRDCDEVWMREILGGHYRTWSYFEYGVFKVCALSQREALSDTISTVFVLEAGDRMRHAQDIVLYMMDLEEGFAGFRDAGSKERWTGDPIYQPARRMTEELMAVRDWGELAVATNLCIDPIFSEVGVSQLLRRSAPGNGDTLTPIIVLAAERDRRRNRSWTEALVRMVTNPELSSGEPNRKILQGWIECWTARAVAATRPLRAVYERAPRRKVEFDDALSTSLRAQRALIDSLGLDAASAVGEAR